MRLFAGIVLSLPREEFETTMICIQRSTTKDNVQEAVQGVHALCTALLLAQHLAHDTQLVTAQRSAPHSALRHQRVVTGFTDTEHYWHTGTVPWSKVRKAIAAAHFDAIVYPEIGMVLCTHPLALTYSLTC